jgi:hypothetical protein
MALTRVALVIIAIGMLFAFGPAFGVSTLLQQDFARYCAVGFVMVGMYFLVTGKPHRERSEYEAIERNLSV